MSNTIKHLTSIKELSKDDILQIMNLTKHYCSTKKRPLILNDLFVANIFYENCTHTKYSFEIAAKRLGASFLQFEELSSEKAKGMYLVETIQMFNCLGIDVGIIRHPDTSFIESLKNTVGFKIVNAGSGLNEHPTQSLLDLYTIYKRNEDLENYHVALYGDIRSCRVSLSNIELFKKMNIKVSICPDYKNQIKNIDYKDGVFESTKEDAFKQSNYHIFVHSVENFDEKQSFDLNNLDELKDDAIFTLTGPSDFRTKVDNALSNHPRCVAYEQLEDKIFLNMAIFDWIMT